MTTAITHNKVKGSQRNQNKSLHSQTSENSGPSGLSMHTIQTHQGLINRAQEPEMKHYTPQMHQVSGSNPLSHHPQILDEDTEMFKMRLDDMTNRFKLETLTEFMSAKKNLLDEQQRILSEERLLNETKYQSKCFEVDYSHPAARDQGKTG